ncbi:unnamed protein product [Sphagnum troendelagicum]|uniref:ARM repeat superfamily protein n=1 Tax=Sphagnum troendelagicum TaxID=128251 RepID=A0ABP0TWY1_9BRYO
MAVTLFDSFHEVRKSACNVLVLIASRHPDAFGNKTGIFLKALIPSINHSHSRVRIAALQAINGMVQCGLTANTVAAHLAPGVKPLAFDHTTTVRELFFVSVANWLNYKDRSKDEDDIKACIESCKIPRFYIPELLPLLLVGMTDVSPDLAALTLTLLEGVGEIYLKFINELDSRKGKDSGRNTEEDDERLMKETMEAERKFLERQKEEELQWAEEHKRAQLAADQLAEEQHPLAAAVGPGPVETSSSSSSPIELVPQTTTVDALKDLQLGNVELGVDHQEFLSAENYETKVQESDTIRTMTMMTALSDVKNCEEFPLQVHEETTTSHMMISDTNAAVDLWESEKQELVSVATTVATDQEGLGVKDASSPEKTEETLQIQELDGDHIIKQSNIMLSTAAISTTEDNSSEDEKNETEEEDHDDKNDLDSEGLQLSEPYKGRRPGGAGCRLMVEAFLEPMISPAIQELRQWTAPTRLGAARLLHTILMLAEGHAVKHLDILIPAFCSAVGDDNATVAEHVIAAVHVLGFHVSPKNWLPLVLQPLASPQSSQPHRANVLVVISALVYRTPHKAMKRQFVEKLCNGLYQKEVCCSDHLAVQNQLLSVVTNIVKVAGNRCHSSSFKLFVLLLQLQSAEGLSRVQAECGVCKVLDMLAKVLGMESARELYIEHIHNLMEIITTGYKGWSSGLPGKLLFQTFMHNAGDTVGPYLKTLLPLFGSCLKDDQDPALRISFLQLLDDLFEKPELGDSWSPLASSIIGELLIPCAVWRASKTAAAIRHAAMVALGTFLRRDLCTEVGKKDSTIIVSKW